MSRRLANNTLLHGFEIDIRPLYLCATDLSFVCRWEDEKSDGYQFPVYEEEHHVVKSIKFTQEKRIYGSGTTRDLREGGQDKLKVIGTDFSPTSKFKFEMSSFSELKPFPWDPLENHMNDDLKDLKKNIKNNDGTELLEFLTERYKPFDRHPPTARISFSEEDENYLWVSIRVPEKVFDDLLKYGDRREIHFNIKLAATFVKNTYDHSYPTTFGLLQVSKWKFHDSPGWLTSVSWGIPNGNQQPDNTSMVSKTIEETITNKLSEQQTSYTKLKEIILEKIDNLQIATERSTSVISKILIFQTILLSIFFITHLFY